MSPLPISAFYKKYVIPQLQNGGIIYLCKTQSGKIYHLGQFMVIIKLTEKRGFSVLLYLQIVFCSGRLIDAPTG